MINFKFRLLGKEGQHAGQSCQNYSCLHQPNLQLLSCKLVQMICHTSQPAKLAKDITSLAECILERYNPRRIMSMMNQFLARQQPAPHLASRFWTKMQVTLSQYNERVVSTNKLLQNLCTKHPKLQFWKHRGLWKPTEHTTICQDGVRLSVEGTRT